MTARLRIGTRGSPLARAQTALAAGALGRAHPDLAEPGELELLPLELQRRIKPFFLEHGNLQLDANARNPKNLTVEVYFHMRGPLLARSRPLGNHQCFVVGAGESASPFEI
mgnify:CR=1 FL=1